MKLLIAIPVMDQMDIAKISLAQWDWMTTRDGADFLMIDNGSSCNWQRWLRTAHLKDPGRWDYIRNDENIGMIRSAQQAYTYACSEKYTHLALAHDDVWIYREDWDYSLQIITDKHPLGCVGLFGSKGCDSSGIRLNTFGNVLDPGHGRRMERPWEPACILDGFFQCFNMEMLKAIGGFDQRYQWMHIYDYDFSLMSIWAGWKNAVLNIPCHHLSGLTANNAAAATSGEDKMKINQELFFEKWQDRLGVSVNDADWSYTWQQH